MGESAGTQTFKSIEHSDVILVIGANPTDGHPVFASRMKRRLRQGAKLIVIDPRRIDLVKSPHVKADYHLQLRPGTNVAVVSALAHVIVTEGLLNESFISERCEPKAFDEWKAFVSLPENSPEAMEQATGVPAATVRAAARLYATGGNAAIYYGLGVTEHAQGSTTVMGIANLAMATGNIGREGVGVNPLRGQNNVQGSCDIGSFPHELPGYRHVSDSTTRSLFESAWGVQIQPEPGLRIPNMFDAALDGSFMGLYCQGEDIVQSDPNTQHVAAALSAMECIVVQDIFLNETAKYAHVLLPGSSFLEKDGTFTNAERRISRVRKVMPPKAGYADWEVTIQLAKRLGYDMPYTHPSQIMDEIAALTPTFHGVSYDKLERLGSIQWPCNDDAPEGTPIMHVDRFVRGMGKFIITKYIATDEKVTRKYPLILTTGRILSQYNVGAQTRRTENVRWHAEDRLEIHPHDAEERGIKDADWVGIQSRAGETVLRAQVSERMQPGVVVYHFPFPGVGRECHHDGKFGLGNQLPRIQGDGGAGNAGATTVRMATGIFALQSDSAGFAWGCDVDPHRVICMERNSNGGASRFSINRLRAGEWLEVVDDLIEEVPVAFEYNGISHAVMLASPLDLEEFALGFSLSEGICESAKDFFDVEVAQSAAGITLQIKVSGEAFVKLKERRRNLTGRSGCGLCGVESLEQVLRPLSPCHPTQALSAASVRRALADLQARQPLNRLTGGAHAAAWCAPGGDLLAVYEDVGRHNALDKLIGAMAKQRMNVHDGFVLMTSRASVELVQKAATFGVSALVAISAPTALAVRTARDCGMTLLAFARGEEFVAYANNQNIRLD